MKKQDIFNTTLSLIVRQGLHNTPMSAIAKESNAAIGTIYHHFKNKKELVHALYMNIHKELDDVVLNEEVDIKNYESEFAALFLRIFKFFIQNPKKFKFLQQYEHSPYGYETEELNAHIEYPIQIDFFTLGQDRGLVKLVSLSLISNLVYINAANLVRLQLTEKVELNRDMIASVIEGCWAMLKK